MSVPVRAIGSGSGEARGRDIGADVRDRGAGARRRAGAPLSALLASLLLASAVIGMTTAARGQAPGPGFNRDDPMWVDDDRLDIEQPEDWGVYAYYDVYENHFRDPGDPEDKRAVNINTLGEVPDSSWWNNRLGVRDMSVEEIAQGPNLTGGPADGPWTVIGRPSGGVTPKFLIEDTEGQRFILKFDPIDHPEIASVAEMVSSRLYHAFGFNVAEAYIVHLARERLRIGEDATFTNDVGERVVIDDVALDHWLSNSPVTADGTYRALASKFVPGEGVGEFRFFGTRPDDPNDIFPHENRRELRGYRVIAAWTNHDDSRALNTYDAYVEEDGSRFVKHYVLDFGSTLGSASIGPNEPRGGNEYFLDAGPTWKTAITLGIWRRPWLHADYPDHPAIGRIEADYFRPEAWKPEYPNAAFERLDAADGFWAARIVSRFSDEAVRAVVEGARITDPEAEAYLLDTLLARRDQVVAHWLTQANPIDELELAGGRDDLTLSWDNAALRVGAARGAARYVVRWSSFDNRTAAETDRGETATPETSIMVPADGWGPPDAFGFRYVRARIGTGHAEFPGWERPVVVTLRDRGADGIDIVGIERPREFPRSR